MLCVGSVFVVVEPVVGVGGYWMVLWLPLVYYDM